MNINECIRQGLLKKIEKDDKKAVRSIGISKMKLSKASKLLDNGFVEDSVINSYAAMFHASRAILFMDGFKEKSHYAIYVYLREKYINKIEPRFLNEIDALRLERHEILYSLEPITMKEEDGIRALSIAKDFIVAIEKIL